MILDYSFEEIKRNEISSIELETCVSDDKHISLRVFEIFYWFLNEICSYQDEFTESRYFPVKFYYVKHAEYNYIPYNNFVLIGYGYSNEKRVFDDCEVFKLFELDKTYDEEEAPTLHCNLDYDKVRCLLNQITYEIKIEIVKLRKQYSM